MGRSLRWFVVVGLAAVLFAPGCSRDPSSPAEQDLSTPAPLFMSAAGPKAVPGDRNRRTVRSALYLRGRLERTLRESGFAPSQVQR